MRVIPDEIFQNLLYLKLYDVTLIQNQSLRMLSSLRRLDIGYAAVADSELLNVLSQNAHSLEELSLNWLMEAQQKPLFSSSPGPLLEKLKSFVTKGPLVFSLTGLQEIIGEGRQLRELKLQSLSISSSQTWAQVLQNISNNSQPLMQMHSVGFGAATNCTDFWDSVAQFLNRCSGHLRVISINGGPRGSNTRIPDTLRQSLLYDMARQPYLSDLILAWRNDIGIDYDTVLSLRNLSTALDLLHLIMRFPPENAVNHLLELIAPFTSLRKLHLVFTRCSDDEDPDYYRYRSAHIHAGVEIGTRGRLWQEFVRKATILLPQLEEVSWSLFDRFMNLQRSFGTSMSVYQKVGFQSIYAHTK